MPTAPDRPAAGPMSRLTRAALLQFYRRRGWRAEGTVPADGRYVIIAAPHTSNWDFVYFLGLVNELGIDAHFMAKDTLFRWPLGGFMRAMGGVEIRRDQRRDTVAAMIAEFARRDRFALTIAPEGTRSHAPVWRSGFYHIALGAGVPIVPGFMDYARRVGGTWPALMPTGDYRADMARLGTLYRDVTPRHPERGIRDWDRLAD
jgi:1-acyl-sn-glycerol-3-phosphate acyltransferase